MDRPRLKSIFDTIGKHKVTTIVAGAGYGKTTAAGQALSHLGMDAVWFRLDKHDTDVPAFLRYLIASLKTRYPDLGDITLDRLNDPKGKDHSPEALTYLLLGEIETRVDKELVIVLDDYHHADNAFDINETMDTLLLNSPACIRFILISRTRPNLHLSLMKARRDLLEIKEWDLAFSPSEIDGFFKTLFHITLSGDNIAQLAEKTGGWVSALILFSHAIENKPDRDMERMLSRMDGAAHIMAAYLEENIFSTLPPDLRDFLVVTSVITPLDTEVINTFLGINHAGDILRDLEHRHLFTFAVNDTRTVFQYHQLFQDFLLMMLRRFKSRAQMENLHRKLGHILLDKGYALEALEQFLKGRDYTPASELIIKTGRRLLYQGQINRLKSYLNGIPDDVFNREPRLLILYAQMLKVSGKPSKGAFYLNRALTMFEQRGDTEEKNQCLSELAYHYFFSGDYAKYEEAAGSLLMSTGSNLLLKCELLGGMIMAAVFLGKLDDAQRFYDESTVIGECLPSGLERELFQAYLDINIGYKELFSGCFSRALSLGQKALRVADQSGMALFQGFANELLGYVHFYSCEFKQGIDHIRQSIAQIEGTDMELNTLAYLILIRGQHELGAGDHENALKSFEESCSLFINAGHVYGQASTHLMRLASFMESGDWAPAGEQIRAYTTLTRHVTNGFIDGQFYLLSALFHLEHGNRKDAGIDLEKAGLRLKPYGVMTLFTDIVRARSQQLDGDSEKAIQTLNGLLPLTASHGMEIIFVLTRRWSAPLLVELYARGIRTQYLKNVFRKMGISAVKNMSPILNRKEPSVKKAARQLITTVSGKAAPPLNIRCFGVFEIHKGGEDLKVGTWKNQKGKSLLKYLIANRHRGFIPKDVFMELLWPEEDEDKSVNRFRVTMTKLRQFLEPGLIKGMNSSYIQADKDTYRLHPGEGGGSDIECFLDEIRQAEKKGTPDSEAVTHYLKAESLYRGDFLAEDYYTDWVIEARDIYQNTYTGVLKKIVACFMEANDHPSAITYLKKWLTIDPYSEEAYCDLMTCYFKILNKRKLTETYLKARKHITQELGFPLSHDTETLYAEFMDVLKPSAVFE